MTLSLLAGLLVASALVWLAGTGSGTAPWAMPRPGSLGTGDAYLLLLAALSLAGGILVARWQAPAAIITVSDEGVTIRLTQDGERPPAFVPHVLLRTIDVVPIHGGDKVLTIRARAGAHRRWCQIRSREATGTDAHEIARQIASRARAAGVAVIGPEMRGMFGLESVWTFGAADPAP